MVTDFTTGEGNTSALRLIRRNKPTNWASESKERVQNSLASLGEIHLAEHQVLELWRFVNSQMPRPYCTVMGSEHL